ncbi:hypothetical protein MMC07_000018 [Pseudocyphellaria aurata]|nr:hypothetical protein [Pseudocyphellaria aurata]
MPVPGNYNFMVVGEGIIAHWPTKKGGGFRPVEGTSYATAVAVSIAALILAFANQNRCRKLRKESEKTVCVEELRDIAGMERVLHSISKEPIDRGYLWINPMLLWAEFPEDEDESAEAIRQYGWKKICNALQK